MVAALFGKVRLPKQAPEAFLVVLALLAALPTLRMGFHFDDWWHLVVARSMHTEDALYGMFRFAGGGGPVVPYWWADPELKLAFFRPLSAALVLLDDWLYGDRAWLWHLDLLGWWLGFFTLVRGVHRAALPRRPGMFGSAAFALDDAHLYPLLWLANRNAIVSGVFGLLALAAHTRWRKGDRKYVAAELVAWTLAFLGGEGALSMLGFLVAWEALVAIDDRPTRARALLPAAAITALWGVFYLGNGFGTRGSGGYFDPLGDPVGWLTVAPWRALGLLGQLLGRAPVDVWLIDERLAWWPVISALIAIPVWALLLRHYARVEPARWYGLRWLLAGAALSMIPLLSAFPSSRLLLVPSIGTSAAVGALIEHAWRTRRDADRPPRWYQAIVALMAFGAFVGAPLSLLSQGDALRRYAEFVETTAERSELGPYGTASIVLFAPDPGTAIFYPAVRYLRGDPPRPWFVLSLAHEKHVFRRIADDTLEVELVGGHFLGTEWERLYRATPLRVGDRLPWGPSHVDIVETDGVGPTKIRFVAPWSLDDPRTTWIAWTGDRFAPTTLPPVGGELVFDAARPIGM